MCLTHRVRRPRGGCPRRLGRVIASDVLERVLAGAVSTGADFAEVYAEDKRSTSAGLDDGKVEQVSSGRDRGAGIRVGIHLYNNEADIDRLVENWGR